MGNSTRPLPHFHSSRTGGAGKDALRPPSFSTSCPSALFVQKYARHVPLRYFPCKGNPPLGALQGHMPYRALRYRNFPGSLPSFSPARGTAKRRYSGKLPPRSLVWLPEGDLINARKKRKRGQAPIPNNKKTQGTGICP